MSRGMMSLLAGLAGAGKGYNDATRERLDNERRAKLDQITLDRAERDRIEFDQQQRDREDLRAAGAPVVATPDMAQTPDGAMQRMVKPGTQDNIDVGQPGEQAPAPAMRVGMQGMLNQQQAGDAVAQQNAPDAVADRQMAVLQRTNPTAAAQMRASRNNAELDALRLQEAKTAAAQRAVSAGLRKAAAAGWADLGAYMNKSGAENETGEWVPSVDGKSMTAHQHMPDGSLKPVPGMTFPNTVKGRLMAAQALDQSIPTEAKLKFIQDEEEAARKAENDKTRLKIDQQRADTDEAYRRDMAAAALNRSEKPAGADKMSEADKLALNDLNDQAKAIDAAILKARAEGTFEPESANAKALLAQRNALRVRASTLLSKYENGGAPTADPAGLRTPTPAGGGRITPEQQAANDSDRGTILAAEYNKAAPGPDRDALMREIDRLPAMERTKAKAAIGAAPAAAPAARAVAPASAAGAPGAPAAPVQPGVAPAASGISRFIDRLGELGVDYTTPQGKAKLRARIAEANAGGPPLTETEKLRAKQAGFI